MNKLVQVVLCVVLAAAVSAKPGYLGLGLPYAAHVGAYLGHGDHSGAYIHDPSGDHAVPYIHDPSGDHDFAGAYGAYGAAHLAVAGAYPYGAVPYAAGLAYGVHGLHGVHGVPLPVHDTPEVAAAKAAHFAAHAAAAHGHHYG